MILWILILFAINTDGQLEGVYHMKTFKNKAACMRQMNEAAKHHPPEGAQFACVPVDDIGLNVDYKPLPLEKPQYEWVRCNCPNGTELGLTDEDFIKQQMYVAGLEHEYERCNQRSGLIPDGFREDGR